MGPAQDAVSSPRAHICIIIPELEFEVHIDIHFDEGDPLTQVLESLNATLLPLAAEAARHEGTIN